MGGGENQTGLELSEVEDKQQVDKLNPQILYVGVMIHSDLGCYCTLNRTLEEVMIAKYGKKEQRVGTNPIGLVLP